MHIYLLNIYYVPNFQVFACNAYRASRCHFSVSPRVQFFIPRISIIRKYTTISGAPLENQLLWPFFSLAILKFEINYLIKSSTASLISPTPMTNARGNQ